MCACSVTISASLCKRSSQLAVIAKRWPTGMGDRAMTERWGVRVLAGANVMKLTGFLPLAVQQGLLSFEAWCQQHGGMSEKVPYGDKEERHA